MVAIEFKLPIHPINKQKFNGMREGAECLPLEIVLSSSPRSREI